MHDHDDIDALALPDRPPEDAPILVLLAHLARLWWRSSRWHWTTVLDTGITRYQVNGRGERRVSHRPGGYQPIDQHWVETGEWAPMPRPPRGKSAIPARPLVIGVTAAEASENIARAFAACPSVRPPVSGSRRD